MSFGIDTTTMPTEPEHEDAARVDAGGAVASRLVKKVKISSDALVGVSSPRARLEHPLGVKPIGNYFEDAVNGVVECRASGLGRLAMLEDNQLLSLLNYLSARDLATLAACSRAGYVYATHDELWRVLVLEEMEANFEPKPTWKATYLKTKYGEKMKVGAPIRVQGVYSDLLFQSFYCAAAPIEDAWLAVENIERRSAKNMTVADFKRDFEGPNVPVIIMDAIDDWAAMDKWTDEYLGEVCKGKTFYAGGFQFAMDKYFNYARTLLDDQPLFVFDKEFAAKVPQLGADYAVPEYFQEDYFSLLGEDKRSDYRWLIIGPKKSGSSFHIDPNATNAWNGVVRGSKKWIMFPPGQVPPGIHPSEDGSEVSSPVSLMEWFVTFYKQVQKLPAHLKPLEGICRERETMFVPHGWWHTVLNLDECVAMTQNFVSSSNVKSVLEFLTEKPEQVSGCPMEQRPKLGRMFRDVMAKNAPELFAKVDKELKEEYERKHRKTKWELLISEEHSSPASSSDPVATTTGSSGSASTFGFGFNFD
ncbi:F-box protein [Phytophthora fragariae]|uniref:F-box protein n=1 Tax=Phytophthora fragariae TaxID=53985 RepID=A0A6G0SC54_9STRA|nr:F-box protein [Phytophthora fragariae]